MKTFSWKSLALLNDGCPTHLHVQTNSYSTTDLSLCSIDALGHFTTKTDTGLHGSDHFPLYLSAVEYLPQHSYPRWIIKRANWEEFSEQTKKIREVPETEPLEYYNRVTEIIQEAAAATIPKSDGYFKQRPVPWWNDKCETSKRERNRAQRQLFKYPTTANWIQYKKTRGLHQRILKDSRKSSWKHFVSSVNSNTECSKVCRKVEKIKGKYSPRPLPKLKSER